MRVLIPDAESGHALGVIQSLFLCKGIEIVSLATRKSNAARFVGKMTACETIEQRGSDIGRVETLLTAAEEYGVDIIVPVDEFTTGLFSKYSDVASCLTPIIPIPSHDSFKIATDKALLARFCAKNGIPHPRTLLVDEFDKVRARFGGSTEFPVLLKPVRGEGGKGIKLCRNEAEFLATDFTSTENMYGTVVVQEFIEGYDIDLSLLAVDGDIVAYTMQKGILGRKSRFAASGGIEFVSLPPLLKSAENVIRALNYSGVAHLDFRWERRTGLFKLVDMNCRFWGSLLGSTKCGVNFPWLACQAGLGERIDFKGFEQRRYFDFLSAAKDPLSALKLKVRPRETNMDFWIRAPLANLANTFYRRSSFQPAQGDL